MMEMVIFVLAGFLVMRFKVFKQEGFEVLSKLVISVTLPLFIFQKLITGFSFKLYSNWWVFPLMSFAVTAAGFIIGHAFVKVFKVAHKREFLSLTTFQNSGYLPLAIVSALLTVWQAQVMFIYIFLFLLGFNLLVWSFGMCMLSKTCDIKDKSMLRSLFSPPVVATVISLIFVFSGINKFIPEFVIRPIKSIGDTTIPLALIVLGGNLSRVNIKDSINREALLVTAAKLFLMPILAILFLKFVTLPKLMALLLLLEMAVPSATSLAVISRRYRLEDKLISGTILLTHAVSLVTLPLFLVLFDLVLT